MSIENIRDMTYRRDTLGLCKLFLDNFKDPTLSDYILRQFMTLGIYKGSKEDLGELFQMLVPYVDICSKSNYLLWAPMMNMLDQTHKHYMQSGLFFMVDEGGEMSSIMLEGGNPFRFSLDYDRVELCWVVNQEGFHPCLSRDAINMLDLNNILDTIRGNTLLSTHAARYLRQKLHRHSLIEQCGEIEYLRNKGAVLNLEVIDL